MPLYQYKAISEKGKKIGGSIDADSLQEAKQKLIRLQISVLKVELLSEKQLKTALKKKELFSLTSELTRLLQAGLPLFEALSALEEKYKGQKIHSLLLDLCDQVKSGESFSRALGRHQQTFDLLFVSMISNAEKTGRLAETLEELSILLQRQMKIRKQIVSALLYPSLLATFCLVILLSLLFFVVPSLSELFEGRELHPLTRIVFACSAFAIQAKSLLTVFSCLILGGIGFLCFSSKGKFWGRKVCSQLPFLKNLFAKIAFVRFCRAAATLLDGGLPVIAAFRQARSVMGHPLLEELVEKAERRIEEGSQIYVPFEKHPLIPPLVPRMMAIAEQGGRLPFMMEQIAEIYEDELETYLNHFASLAQPILLLILGGLVGFVLLSVLLPLTDVSSFIT